MTYIRDRVFILRQDSLREYDAWISMYGRRHGKLVGIARGHRRPNGKQRGHMEPLILADVMVAEGRRYDKVAVSRVIEPFHELRGDLTKVVILSSCLSLADMLTRPGVSDERVFDVLHELFTSLSRLQQSPSPERAQLFYGWFTLRLLGLFGHVASFQSCVMCRSALQGEVLALPEMGGGACLNCRGKLERVAEVIPAMSWKLLRMIQGASCEDIASISAPKSVFRDANRFIADVLQQAPADGSPHGFRTISAVLS